MTSRRQSRAPTPRHPLGKAGLEMWSAIWGLRLGWIDAKKDVHHVQLLCESVDERASLRLRVLRDNEWRERTALRQLDAQISELMGMLGLDPTHRKALSVDGSRSEGRLGELRALRGA